MKFYQSKIFKIIMGLIAIIIIFKYSFLILLAGIGLVVYLNKNNIKFKSFHTVGKIILSSFIVLFTLFAIGIKNAPTTSKSVATNSKVDTSAESAKPVELSEVKEDSKPVLTEEEVKPEVKEDTKSEQPASNDTKTQTANNSAASTNSSTVNNNTSVKSTESTNTNTNSANSNKTTTNTGDENTIVYCVPKSNVYHLSKSDSTLKKSKNIYEITLKEAKAKGMHQSDSKADN